MHSHITCMLSNDDFMIMICCANLVGPEKGRRPSEEPIQIREGGKIHHVERGLPFCRQADLLLPNERQPLSSHGICTGRGLLYAIAGKLSRSLRTLMTVNGSISSIKSHASKKSCAWFKDTQSSSLALQFLFCDFLVR